ncbi:MAG TPA: hypothetical protein VEJ84_14745 [Acidimicrobiales bacterium]|nr:hypothetical protein [Acidimicrobiales bacterium]
MPSYVLTFRGRPDRAIDSSEEAAWGQWFQQIGGSIVEPGNRVGTSTALGDGQGKTVVTGYTVIAADNLDAAVALAKGCPGLAHEGGVEVGEIMPM